MSGQQAPDVLASIAANVKRWRVRRGWTQDRLAARAGMDLRQVQRIEAADTNFGVVDLAAVAAALEVSPSTLLRAARLPPPQRGRPRKKRRRRPAAP